MRRRRWARAAALCLAIVVLLQLAGASGRTTALSVPARGRDAHGQWVPAASPSLPGHHAAPTPTPGGGGRAVAFDATATAAAAGVRCKIKASKARNSAAGGRDAACDNEDEDDKRRVPTGPNPLHNR